GAGADGRRGGQRRGARQGAPRVPRGTAVRRSAPHRRSPRGGLPQGRRRSARSGGGAGARGPLGRRGARAVPGAPRGTPARARQGVALLPHRGAREHPGEAGQSPQGAEGSRPRRHQGPARDLPARVLRQPAGDHARRRAPGLARDVGARYCTGAGKESPMFGLGYQELLIILVIVLVLFGANRLPELARSLGSSVKEFKKGVNEASKEETTPARKEDE